MIYKVMVDLDEVDLNQLFELVDIKKLEVCVSNDCLFFYDKHNRKVQISNIMKKMNTSGFVVKVLNDKPKPDTGDFASTWCYEKMTTEEAEQFEAEHQSELKTMMDNIQTIKQELLKNKEKEGSADGTGDNQERASKENSD